MIDPFDAALSDFIDSLPEEPDVAAALLRNAAPFEGRGDLPELAEFATMLRAVPMPQPSAEWMAASRARLMAAPIVPVESRRGLTWLGTMFMPLSQLSFPSLPALSLPSSLFSRAVLALTLLLAFGSLAYSRTGVNPLLQVIQPGAASPGTRDAQRAITLAEREVALLPQESAAPESEVAGVYIKGTPKDVTLLSQYFAQAQAAIQRAPVDQQSRLHAQLQGVVRAVRFDGLVDAIDGNVVQVSGVPVTVDPTLARQIKIGQSISVIVSVNDDGKLRAVQVGQASSAPRPAAAMAAPASSRPVSVPAGSPAASSPGQAAASPRQPLASPAPSIDAVEGVSIPGPMATSTASIDGHDASPDASATANAVRIVMLPGKPVASSDDGRDKDAKGVQAGSASDVSHGHDSQSASASSAGAANHSSAGDGNASGESASVHSDRATFNTNGKGSTSIAVSMGGSRSDSTSTSAQSSTAGESHAPTNPGQGNGHGQGESHAPASPPANSAAAPAADPGQGGGHGQGESHAPANSAAAPAADPGQGGGHGQGESHAPANPRAAAGRANPGQGGGHGLAAKKQ